MNQSNIASESAIQSVKGSKRPKLVYFLYCRQDIININQIIFSDFFHNIAVRSFLMYGLRRGFIELSITTSTFLQVSSSNCCSTPTKGKHRDTSRFLASSKIKNQSNNASKSLGLMILTPLKFFSTSKSASPVTR